VILRRKGADAFECERFIVTGIRRTPSLAEFPGKVALGPMFEPTDREHDAEDDRDDDHHAACVGPGSSPGVKKRRARPQAVHDPDEDEETPEKKQRAIDLPHQPSSP
jgi:hypothetical protein